MSTPRSTNRRPWIDAAEACEWLGVKRQTLYTYASRGRVQTRREGRKSLYRSQDLAELESRSSAHAGRSPRAAGALHWGEPVLTTAISAIDADGPYYRGVPAVDLVATPLEEVAELLWGFSVDWPEVVAPRCHNLLALRMGVDHLALEDVDRAHRSCDRDRAARIVCTLFAAVAPPPHPDVKAAMVLCADHGLNASTFTARVIASTGADLYAGVSGALAALSGPRHGALSLRMAAVLQQFDREGADPILRSIDTDGTLPGFGHPLYPLGDPRAELLLTRAGAHPEGPQLASLMDLIEVADSAGLKPNLDAGLVALCLALGEPVSKAPLWFAAGRSIGWLAHIFEQRTQSGILRPRAAFSGW